MDLSRAARRIIASLGIVGAVIFGAPAKGGTEDMAALRLKFQRPDETPFPSSNPYSLEKAALGKALFFEPRLSGAENMTCASCHNPSFGWEDRNKTSVGGQNTHLPRHAPTILDAAWGQSFFWDGRAATAEAQASGPIQAPAEMNLPLATAIERLSGIPDYKSRFTRIFPDKGITAETIVAAIATYERTVVAGYAPFDAWIDGDEAAIPDSAKRGFVLFNTKAQCASCHIGWRFTDGKFHDTGLADGDIGRGKYEANNPKAQFAFKTPSLRDLTLRSPYMYAGQFATLEEVVAFYVRGGVDRPSRSDLIRPISLSAEESADLVAFMHTLTGSTDVVALPVLPN